MGKIEIDILNCSQKNEHFTYAGQMKYLQTRDFKWMSTQRLDNAYQLEVNIIQNAFPPVQSYDKYL